MQRTRIALIVIALNNMLLTWGFNLWQSVFSNFAVQEMKVRADQIGLIQAIREVPGLLGFAVALLALLVVEIRIAGVSVVVMGIGIFLTATSRGLPGLIGATLVMSTGFHFFSASNYAAVLLTVPQEDTPKVLGRLNSLAALATVLSTLFIFGTLETWGYRTLFCVAGLVVTIGSVVLLPFGRQPIRARRALPFSALRLRYWPYYALQFLWGSRRHIFTTFAVFLLVKDYQVSAQIITLLYLANSLIGTYVHQAFGKTVARFGERRVLSVNFALLTLIFLGYVLVPITPALQYPTLILPQLRLGSWSLMPALLATPALLILLGLFVVDNVLFGFQIALECYLQKVALGPGDITPNVSMGQTMNHVAAVIIPFVGGVIWEKLGAQYTFLTGVGIALAALVLAQWLRAPGSGAAHAAAVEAER